MTPEERTNLVQEHDHLRILIHTLEVQTTILKRRLAELEVQIPDLNSRPVDVLPENKEE